MAEAGDDLFISDMDAPPQSIRRDRVVPPQPMREILIKDLGSYGKPFKFGSQRNNSLNGIMDILAQRGPMAFRYPLAGRLSDNVEDRRGEDIGNQPYIDPPKGSTMHLEDNRLLALAQMDRDKARLQQMAGDLQGPRFDWGRGYAKSRTSAYASPEQAEARYDQLHGFMERDTADYLRNR